MLEAQLFNPVVQTWIIGAHVHCMAQVKLLGQLELLPPQFTCDQIIDCFAGIVLLRVIIIL